MLQQQCQAAWLAGCLGGPGPQKGTATALPKVIDYMEKKALRSNNHTA